MTALKVWVGTIDGILTINSVTYLSVQEDRNKSQGSVTLVSAGLFQLNTTGEYEIDVMFITDGANGVLGVHKDPAGTQTLLEQATIVDNTNTITLSTILNFTAGDRMALAYNKLVDLTFGSGLTTQVSIKRVAD